MGIRHRRIPFLLKPGFIGEGDGRTQGTQRTLVRKKESNNCSVSYFAPASPKGEAKDIKSLSSALSKNFEKGWV